MTTGGVFQLLANDGKIDRMLLATKLLYQRIQDIMFMRTKTGRDDATPTLIDLERTHIIYVNAHFKPFAAIGFEYNKVKPQNGSTNLGGSVTFSIPQFGDFFYDMVCRVRLDSVQANTGVLPAAVPGTGRFVDILRNPVAVSDKYVNNIRYCEYPGHRLFTKVKFDVNGNPLDEYDQYVPVMLDKFTVMPHKREGHDKLVGQQTPLTGLSGLNACPVYDADYSALATTLPWNQTDATSKAAALLTDARNKWNTPAGITRFSQTQSNQTVSLYQPQNLLATNTAIGRGGGDLASSFNVSAAGYNAVVVAENRTLNGVSAPVIHGTDVVVTATNVIVSTSLFDLSQNLKSVVNGPQTPKPVQPPLEIWNKLKFWFNDDVRLSIPSVSIPYGQRFITIDLSVSSALIYESPSIFIETSQNGVTSYVPYVNNNGFVDPQIKVMELYVNNIFVNPEIHDIFIRRIGFALIRVYRQQRSVVNATSVEILLSALKWPIEYMFVGVQPVFNQKNPSSNGQTGNLNVWRDWHRMTRQIEATNDCVSLGTSTTIGQIDPDKYWVPVSTVDNISLTAHGINIYDSFSDSFFNLYQPFHYGCEKIVTPNDTGAFFINLCLFPRDYQVSGHLNLSRSRETYLKFQSSYASGATNCNVIIVAIAINFILISDGSAVLRYST